MHGQSQNLVESNQTSPRHDDRRDQKVGEERKQHGGGGQGTKLGNYGKIGQEEDAESQCQGQARGHHWRGLFPNGGLHRRIIIGGSPAQIVVTGKKVNGPVNG